MMPLRALTSREGPGGRRAQARRTALRQAQGPPPEENTRWLSGVEATRGAQDVGWDGRRAEANSPSTSSGTAEPAGARPQGARRAGFVGAQHRCAHEGAEGGTPKKSWRLFRFSFVSVAWGVRCNYAAYRRCETYFALTWSMTSFPLSPHISSF